MLKYINILISLFIIASTALYSQGHYISGKISDSFNSPLYGANVILKGTYQGSTTDSTGYYKIDNLEPGKYTLMVSYIGYKSSEISLYISEFERVGIEEVESSFSSKLGLEEEDEESDVDIVKSSYHENVDVILQSDALETEQVVVSATKKKEKLIDAPITIAVVSSQQIRKTAGGDLGALMKTVRGVEVYQAGMGRTALNVRGFMSAFNGRFVSLVDGANFMEPTFYIAYGNTMPYINEDIERIEVVFGPSSALYGPNAHNGMLNIITKHPKDSEGTSVVFSSGSSGYTSMRARFAKAINKFSMKFSLENNSVYDWEFPRTFRQDYNLDREITSLEDHEDVIFWNQNTVVATPNMFNDKNNDGEWDHAEEITVMTSEFEREMTNLKANTSFYYDLTPNTEISVGHEHYYQSGYQPFDSGLNFINYTMGSLWTKIASKYFFGRLHWLRSTGTEYWNSDGAYLNMLRRNLTLQESVDKTKIADFVKTDVYRGDFQTSFTLKNIDFIAGGDFSIYRPVSNRQFLDDVGLIQNNSNEALNDSLVGKEIIIDEYGGYIQATIDLPLQTKFVTALRYDKHSYFEHKISPRFALQWNGLKSGNIRFSYNRAFQTPSIYNLHMLKRFKSEDSGNIVPFFWDNGAFAFVQANVNNPAIQQLINTGNLNVSDLDWVPLQTVFQGNREGFTIDETINIDPLQIETVDSYEIGLKTLVRGKLFLDISGFFSKYKNFISPLTPINDFYPTEDPWIAQEVTSVGEQPITDILDRSTTVVYSYTSTSGASIYGVDLMAKYELTNRMILSTGLSIYDNLNFDSAESEGSAVESLGGLDSLKNDTLAYFIEKSLQSYSTNPNRLFFNAPKNKGFLAIAYNGLFTDKLWVQLSGSYAEEFDFVSGYHVATEDTNLVSLSPNSIYDNQGAMGGGWIVDLHLEYTISNKVRLKLQLNNLFDQDGPRVVGTPPMRRNGILEVLFNY